MREQFLVEVADTTLDDLTGRGLSHAAALLELNGLFTAWVESVYHHRVHSETAQTPLQRWNDGWQAAGHRPAMASADALTQAFLWSEWRIVTKTATVTMHGNRYEVEPVLVGRKVELVFSPFDLETIEVHYRGAIYGRAVPHRITRHAHPKARPETTPPPTPAATGIAYLQLVADTHHEQVAADERIGFHALYSTAPSSTTGPETDQLPGQLSIHDALSADAATASDQREQTRP